MKISIALSLFACFNACFAATGILILNNISYKDPTDCINTEVGPLEVIDFTDRPIRVYNATGCTELVGYVRIGTTETFANAASVYVL